MILLAIFLLLTYCPPKNPSPIDEVSIFIVGIFELIAEFCTIIEFLL